MNIINLNLEKKYSMKSSYDDKSQIHNRAATLGRSIELPKYPTPKDKEVYAAAISTAFRLDDFP